MAVEIPAVLAERAAASADRLRQTNAALSSFNLVDEARDDGRFRNVTIFATGSLGRREIGLHSDLDVFIVDAALKSGHDPALSRLDRYLLVADLIRASEAAGYQRFSRDGEFLQVHRLDDLVEFLGTPDEDRLNVFTARLLLLLESECLVARDAYDRSVEFVIGRYWAEAEGRSNFKPTFLINDIVRYWKTLCLSYEGFRESPGDQLTPEDRLDLAKLKFNRVWLCFNGLAYLLLGDGNGEFPQEHAQRLVDLSPVERFLHIAETVPELQAVIEEALTLYAGWLRHTGAAKGEVLAWIGDDREYEQIAASAIRFGDVMWQLVTDLGRRAELDRYLLV
jgi:hypothetical protein